MTDVGWTPDRVEALKGLIAQNHSAADIAFRLNAGFSRSAIIGKINRLGWHLPNAARRVSAEERAERLRQKNERRRIRRARPDFRYVAKGPKTAKERKQQADVNHVRARSISAQIALAASELTDLPAEDAATAVHFMALGADTCRWPIGDSSSLDTVKFCGKQPKHGHPYCSHHHQIAHRRNDA